MFPLRGGPGGFPLGGDAETWQDSQLGSLVFRGVFFFFFKTSLQKEHPPLTLHPHPYMFVSNVADKKTLTFTQRLH